MNDLAIQIEHDSADYARGQFFCAAGIPCPDDATQAFKAGWAEEYEKEQIATANSLEVNGE